MGHNRLKFIVGLFVISFIFWARFLREHTSQEFLNIRGNMEPIVISVIFIGIFSTILIIQIKLLLKINTKSIWVNKLFFNNYSLKLQSYIKEGPSFVYEKLTKNLNLKYWIELPASYFTAYFYYPRMIMICSYLPQIIIATVFLLESCLYYKREYFYKSLVLLIPVLFIQIILFVFRHYSQRRLTHLECYLDVTLEAEGYFISLKVPEQLPQDEPLVNIVNQYGVLCDLWFIYTRINNYMLDIQNIERFCNPYVFSYTASCYVIGWSYTLYYIIFIV